MRHATGFKATQELAIITQFTYFIRDRVVVRGLF